MLTVWSTPECRQWLAGLDSGEKAQLEARIGHLVTSPNPADVHRPYVGTIKASKYPNMKEIIVKYHDIRVLFMFDPDKEMVLLIGGTKQGEYKKWYAKNIPVAERVYAQYLADKQEGERMKEKGYGRVR